MLSGLAIEEAIRAGDIVIDPFDPDAVGPNSYDLTLNPEIKMYTVGGPLDMKAENPVGSHVIPEDGMLLYPGNLYLCCTNEVAGSERFIPCIDGRSSVGRLGIQVHITAGFGDVGFIGQWTLEVLVAKPIRVYPNTRICQIYFFPVDGAASLYKGKYVNSRGAIPSKMFKDREFHGTSKG
jgi:dCTP deaminase